MRSRFLGGVLFPLAVFLLSSPLSAADYYLVVKLSNRSLTVYANNHPVRSYDVAIGSPQHPTPTGSFAIRKVVLNPRWAPPDADWAKGKDPKGPRDRDNPMKVAKLFFQEPDYYIHGTSDVDSLTRAESHGCLRMHPKDVAELAKEVMAHGGKPMPEPWYRRIFRRRTTKVVRLTTTVPVIIQP